MGSKIQSAMTALSDGTVVAFGAENKQNKLKRFSLKIGRKLGSTDVNNVHGIAEVKLGGRSTIVVSD